MTGGDPLLFVDPDVLAESPLEGSRRLSKSVLPTDDKSMRDGSVGRVSGEPLLVPEERSEEAPAERPREESDLTSRSGGTEEPETRFAIGCASPVVDRCRWGGAPTDDDDDPKVARLLNVRRCGDIQLGSGPEWEKLRVLFTESGRLDTEVSESAESPDGDKERDNAGGMVDLADSPEGAGGLDSWAENEEGEERGSG